MTIKSIYIIYIGIIKCILLYIFKCIHECVWVYKLVVLIVFCMCTGYTLVYSKSQSLEKIKLKSKLNFN